MFHEALGEVVELGNEREVRRDVETVGEDVVEESRVDAVPHLGSINIFLEGLVPGGVKTPWTDNVTEIFSRQFDANSPP